MDLSFTRDQVKQMVNHAQDEYPHEACGVIGGLDAQVLTIIPLRNISPEPQHHYHIDDAGLTKALFDLQNKGWSLIGFYHSHPKGDPIPSPTDIQQATYPNTPYVIIGLRQRDDPAIAAWEMTYGKVSPVELTIGTLSSNPSDAARGLSSAQRVAIILGAAVAFIFMLILSVTLLPPAPIIP